METGNPLFSNNDVIHSFTSYLKPELKEKVTHSPFFVDEGI